MFDMLIDMGSELPFIIEDKKAKGGKQYEFKDLCKLLPKKEHSKFLSSQNPKCIVGNGYHWMPIIKTSKYKRIINYKKGTKIRKIKIKMNNYQ